MCDNFKCCQGCEHTTLFPLLVQEYIGTHIHFFTPRSVEGARKLPKETNFTSRSKVGKFP